MKKDIFDLILKIIIALLALLVIYWGIQLIFGGSPTLSQFNNSLILILIGLIVHLYYKFGSFDYFINGTFPRIEKNIEHSFNKMKEDISLIKNRLKI